jgi:hypothetical protein
MSLWAKETWETRLPRGEYQTHDFTNVAERIGYFMRNSLQVFFIGKEAFRLGRNVPVLPAETNLFGPTLPFPDHSRPEDISQEAPDSTFLNQVALSDNEEPYQGSVEERLVFEMDRQWYLPGPALEFVGLSRRIVTNC